MTTYTENDTLAFKLLTQGYSIIPSGGGEKGKSPIVDWIPFQRSIPTDAQFEGFMKLKPHLWGIVTGQTSGVDVLDVDTEAERVRLQSEGLTCHVVTPRNGGHFYFEHKAGIPTKAGLLPNIDTRAEGGFVNAIGHNGDGDYQILQLPQPENLNTWDKVPERISIALVIPLRKQLPVMDRGYHPGNVTIGFLGWLPLCEGRVLQRKPSYRALGNAMRGIANTTLL
jgi:hypothetical protein